MGTGQPILTSQVELAASDRRVLRIAATMGLPLDNDQSPNDTLVPSGSAPDSESNEAPAWRDVDSADLAERKRNQAEGWTLDDQRRLMIDSVPALIAYIDRDFRYVLGNETYRLWFGRDPDSL